jgi:hypothetical protein
VKEQTEGKVDGLGIVGSIKVHFVYHAEGETSPEFNSADNKTNSIMPGTALGRKPISLA